MSKNPFSLIDWVHRIKNYGKQDQFLTVYQSQEFVDGSVFIYCGLIPDARVAQALKSPGWDLRIGCGAPTTSIKHNAFGRGKHDYGYERCPTAPYESLVHFRDFHGIRESYVEVSEEFRLYHDLCFVGKKHKFIKINDDGTESDAILLSTPKNDGYRAVRISKKLLNNFCLVKRMHLAIFFSIKRKRAEPLSNSEKTSRLDFSEGLINLSQSYYDSSFGGSCSQLCGKRLFPGDSRDSKHPWNFGDEGKLFEEFIVGVDDNGEEIRARCGPSESLRKGDRVHFYTTVYFKKEVFDKYRAHPEKYQIEDGYLYCLALWGLRIDNNHAEYVSAYLGDIGQMLSEKEQAYWKSCNFWPTRQGLSEAAFQRDVLGEFGPANALEFVFKRHLSDFQDKYRQVHDSILFKDLEEGDRHHLQALHVPLDGRQGEFDSQILSLSKILVDSLSDEELERRLNLQDNKELLKTTGEMRTIQKLENLLTVLGDKKPRQSTEILRTIQSLRSASAAHRKGPHFKKLWKELDIEEKGVSKVFSELLQEACQFLVHLGNLLIDHRLDAPNSSATSPL